VTKGWALLLTVALTGALAVTTGAFSPGGNDVHLQRVSTRVDHEAVSLVIDTTAPVPYIATRPDPLTVLVECRNLDITGAVNAVEAGGRGPVAAVAVEQSDALGAETARVRISLSKPVTYHVRSDRNRIVVDFDKPAGLMAAVTPTTPGGPVDPIAALGLDQAPVDQAALTAGRAVETLAAQAPATAAPAQAPSGSQPAPGQRQYSGEPVSLDFQGADLRSVLRTFSEISGLNVVIDPTVTGSVDVALHEVPWDQALDIILRANKLGYIVDGTVVRIAPLTVLADEETQRRNLADEQALAGQLQVLTKTLSYAKAQDLQPLLTASALSQRGTVQVDPRTNTLIITDLPDRLQTADSLIQSLDKPQPQVEIEARIVQTNRDYAKALGVQWGFNGIVDPRLGNTTNLAFPNSGSLGGRTGGSQGPQDGTSSSTAVNLGVPAASSAVGLALGSVNGSFNLDMALSALEKSGNGRLLSTPRVSTQNNVEAEITQGVQIPIQTVSNNTVTVSFRDAALTLRVTPQITSANTVIMQIAVENASPDFSRAVNGIPPINTQRATTQVLVNDGMTTVIGGIFVSQEQSQTDRTPGLSHLPFLGWLFKRDSTTDQSSELLIFITPRIIRS
jgi:type IV pilus assembly protein PilQ